MLIQVCLSMVSTIVPSWWSLALMPCSAMKRKAEPSCSEVKPDFTELAFQNESADSRALFSMARCSNSFVKITYQLPIDMMTRMTSVDLLTMSPSCHMAFRPYGFSTASSVTVGLIGPAAAGAGAASAAWAAAEAGAEASAPEAGCAIAGWLMDSNAVVASRTAPRDVRKTWIKDIAAPWRTAPAEGKGWGARKRGTSEGTGSSAAKNVASQWQPRLSLVHSSFQT